MVVALFVDAMSWLEWALLLLRRRTILAHYRYRLLVCITADIATLAEHSCKTLLRCLSVLQLTCI